ncbi:putative enzyme related to lactoylglutathione lyase [Arthrobacter stackebrandtii]|uniref:Enzyme related to lactoylglutathione lyase n=1 Tax=Arthrobacter stackebrandtii TaxID=272161 RepID=A0ABS4YTT5_9MICC|nr:VOC family protein [Arthrobacter stackebrandtii]MBP2412218.1 putative enzyme related to lactoylglutathione lyase [Arthrobacter stackebrandtii]PYH02004.1 glyoxalase [Arthrobacter stackebrandtii]
MDGTEKTQRTYPQGVPCWIDTEQPDVDAAAAFYGGMFGWTFEDAMPPDAPGRYLIAKLNGQDVGGIAGTGNSTAAWNTYIAVDDADTSSQRLVAAGATMKSPPADAGEGGRAAVLTDPEGAEFRIWQARRRPGSQVANMPGSWNFSDLHTSDPGAATAFYGGAFGWQVDDLGFGLLIRRPGYGDHLEATIDPGIRARQANVATPSGFEDAIAWIADSAPNEPPHWHVSFTVDDRDQAVDAAGRLGASIMGQSDSLWTRTALIRDPQGAQFTASQFTPPSG